MKTCDDGMVGCLEFVCPGAVLRPYADTCQGVLVFDSYIYIGIYGYLGKMSVCSFELDRWRRVKLVRGSGDNREGGVVFCAGLVCQI